MFGRAWKPHKSVLARQRFHEQWIGTYFAIHLDGGFGYGRMIHEGYFACFDLRSTTILPIHEVKKARVLFTVCVTDYAIHDGRWQAIGKEPLEPEFDQPIRFYREDIFTGIVDIYVEGEFEPYQGEDLSKMERCSVWHWFHVESRLAAALFGRKDRYDDRETPEHPWGRPTS